MSCGGHTCASVWVRMHCNRNACVSMVCSIPPLAISRPTESSQNDVGNEDILSQKVYGKLSYVLYCMILYMYYIA